MTDTTTIACTITAPLSLTEGLVIALGIIVAGIVIGILAWRATP